LPVDAGAYGTGEYVVDAGVDGSNVVDAFDAGTNGGNVVDAFVG